MAWTERNTGKRLSWREHARRIIEATARDILADGPADLSEAALRKAISAAYPYGERAHYPYKVWCEELRHFMARREGCFRSGKPTRPDPGQMTFTEEVR